METLKVDFAVIGSGPSGQKGAIQAAKLGASVAVIERDPYPGGVSINRGTIPSKTLRESIIELTNFHGRHFHGQKNEIQKVAITDLYYNLNKVLEQERSLIRRQFTRNKIELIQGLASFTSEHCLDIRDENGTIIKKIEAQFILIAVGSTPRHPLDIPFDDKVVLDSTKLLALDFVPQSMIVLGGGVIGAEYASFFAALGTQVTVLDKRNHMLPSLDTEIGTHFQAAMSEINVKFQENKNISSVEKRDGKAHVTCEDGSTFESDVLLHALGREANVKPLDIDKVGIELTVRGKIPVNPLFQTEVPNIYAAGDVIGGPSLASTSMEQGRLVARHAFKATTHYFPSFYPIGIYTIPEISCCGYTEEELQELDFHYVVGRAYYYEIARSHIAGDTAGLVKLLFHRDTLEILGVHVIGRGATEVIHIGQVAMSFRARIDYFINHVFNYPTYAEGFRIAALNGYNKVRHRN